MSLTQAGVVLVASNCLASRSSVSGRAWSLSVVRGLAQALFAQAGSGAWTRGYSAYCYRVFRGKAEPLPYY